MKSGLSIVLGCRTVILMSAPRMFASFGHCGLRKKVLLSVPSKICRAMSYFSPKALCLCELGALRTIAAWPRRNQKKDGEKPPAEGEPIRSRSPRETFWASGGGGTRRNCRRSNSPSGLVSRWACSENWNGVRDRSVEESSSRSATRWVSLLPRCWTTSGPLRRGRCASSTRRSGGNEARAGLRQRRLPLPNLRPLDGRLESKGSSSGGSQGIGFP